ncbi:carboxymethylenebutenolidase [Apiospora rasikravindrae]|uniref:Carboxymethylenebutenolidase n=1 Tax=Apiospora rasikravindrae TaxID=990691 RepID=A0ABR1RP63_9PEZI
MSSTNPEKTPVPRPSAPSIAVSPTLTLQPPLTRRGHGPGLVLLVDPSLDLSNCHDKTLDPPPLQKWAEEGYAVAQLKLVPNEVVSPGGLLDDEELHQAIQALEELPSCDGARELGLFGNGNLSHYRDGHRSRLRTGPRRGLLWSGASLLHRQPASRPGSPARPEAGQRRRGGRGARQREAVLLRRGGGGGPFFDLEKIWDEHTYWEFEARDVEQTMATMVEEPYVNHIPTLTGGIGREKLTEFYTNHFVFANPPDTELELVSRTVGIDRVIDEFVTKMTHDRVVDWLAPGVPPTGKYIQVPFTSVVNIRGDRLYHEHISWDQGTLLRQLGLLPEYLPFPHPVASAQPGENFEYRVPVAGVESASKLKDESAVDSNAMLEFGPRKAAGQ